MDFQWFFSGADSRRVLVVEFWQMFVIVCSFQGPILRAFGTKRCKKIGVLKKDENSVQKAHAANLTLGLCAP